MKKLITLLMSLTMISCASAFPVYAELQETERDTLKEIAKQFGSETDYLTYPNYATLTIADKKSNKSYAEFLKRCSNAQTFLDPAASYRASLQSGRCMGISLIEILSHNGYFTPSDIHEGVTYLTDIELDDDAKYYTDFYQSVQLFTEFDLYMRWYFSHYSDEERVKMLLDTADKSTKDGKYFLIVLDASNFSHAIVGIGAVDGDWTFEDKHYDKCILTYDSNTINANYFPEKKICWGFLPETSLYINTETNEIYSPAYDDYVKSPLNVFSTDDESLMRYKGLLNPTDSVDTDVSDICRVEVSGSSTYSITGARADGTSYDGVANSFRSYPQSKSTAYYLDGKNFTVENTEGTDLDVTFTDTAHTIICDTNGGVNSIYKDDSEIKVISNGDEIDYNVSVIFNEGSYDFTPHYRWNFEGSTDSQINIKQTDKGLLVSGENGVNCKLTTYDVIFDEEHYIEDTESNCNTAELNSTETLMVYFDENNELKYYEVGKGDINADGSVSVADAVMLQKFLLGNGTLTNWKSADLCKDERVDVFDMVIMRRMIIESISKLQS